MKLKVFTVATLLLIYGCGERVVSQDAPTPTYLLPAQGTITSGYGMRWGRMHQGIDIGVPVGTPVLAAADGVVEFSGWNSGGYGYMVDMRHADGSMTRYAHNSRLLVQTGDRIIQGQTIAESGSTGHSTGPHIHFEIYLVTGETINPMQVLVAVAPEENLVVRSNDPKTSSKELHLVQK
jgi:murein DD-endopeptidase MepM/ murein hydrolase activator NlpD